MINPCGFFSSLMAEVRGDCPREVGRYKSEISKYFLGLHKMLEKNHKIYALKWWFNGDLPWYNPKQIALNKSRTYLKRGDA